MKKKTEIKYFFYFYISFIIVLNISLSYLFVRQKIIYERNIENVLFSMRNFILMRYSFVHQGETNVRDFKIKHNKIRNEILIFCMIDSLKYSGIKLSTNTDMKNDKYHIWEELRK